MASLTKPLVLICVTPIYGHLMPIRAIGKELVKRGYDVTFVTGSYYNKLIEAIGASLVPIEGYGDYTEAEIELRWPVRNTLPAGPAQLAFDIEHCFINSIPSQYEAQERALNLLNEQHPGKSIVLVTEQSFLGAIPGFLGAPGLRPTASLCLGIIPMCLSSMDTAPFGPGLLPDSSPEGRERNIAMMKEVQEEMLGVQQRRFREILADLGAEVPKTFFLDAPYVMPDRFLQMCIPSVEYSRSDAPKSIRFIGGLPKGYRDGFTDQPSWWPEIINNKSQKIVAVSQGSVAIDFEDLVIPTITGLADCKDILVVVALGKKGAALPAGTLVPANVRVADFIPFDELLPHCSVFVTNGGYGAFQHAISNGTPLIIGGVTEDKPEVAARAEWCGVGINLRTANPTPEVVLNSVYEILTNPKYKKRSMELEKEMAQYDPMGLIVQNIDDLVARRA
jgi:UDP:flavonoid glycosyltransferase YjiC (YdhE family)